jgi:hypothetical protein
MALRVIECPLPTEAVVDDAEWKKSSIPTRSGESPMVQRVIGSFRITRPQPLCVDHGVPDR